MGVEWGWISVNPMGKNRYSTSLGKDLVWAVDGAVGDSVVY